MSKSQTAKAENNEPVTLESVRAEIAEVRSLVRDMALLVLPPALHKECEEHGRLANRAITGVRVVHADGQAKPEQKTHHLCDKCELPAGWNVISTVVADGNLQETLRISNRLLDRTR